MTIDEQLLDADLTARQDALDVKRSFIVQAPAGSGKTELLIQRYLNLLGVVANPEEVIAITFTRKAAAEMQYRVLSALQQAQQGVEPEQAHQKLTHELASRALQRDAQFNWNLLTNPRRLRIQTLDSLNGSIARARPLSAPGNAAGVRVIVDAELGALHRSAALATLDWLAEDGELAAATREVLEHVDNNTSIYVEYLVRMLQTRDQWLPFIGAGGLSDAESAALRKRFESNLEAAVSHQLARASAAIDEDMGVAAIANGSYAADNLRLEGNAEHPICALSGVTALPAPQASELDVWQGIAELFLTADRRKPAFRKQVDKRTGFPPGDKPRKEAFKGLLLGLAGEDARAELLNSIRLLPAARYTDEQWQVLRALFQLLPLAVSELQRLFAERGVVDHIDVALTAGAALGTAENPGDVALLLDYQVRHVLVDEMQDTSSAQYRMLEALTGGWEPGDGRTLYCVGDPMQSIYRFRNAEVGQFLLARDNGIGQIELDSLVLRRNFRSGERLVNWFNEVFPGVLAERDDPASGAVSYSSAVPVEQLADIGECCVHPVIGVEKELEAQAGCEVIATTLAAHPDDDMAVLVRSRTHLPALLAELRRAGIDYRAIDIDRLTDLPEIIELLALTRAAVHQGDRVAWLAVLRAPWIGLDWCDLHALARGDREATVWELLQVPERLDALSATGRAAVLAAMPVLQRLVAARPSQTLRALVEECWMALGGAAMLADAYAVDNVYRYLDVLDRHERHGTLDDVATLEALLDEERVSSNASARLQIMTMHKAKGLEFEHVLLYGLGRAPRSADTSVLAWFDIPDEHGAQHKIISPVGPRAVLDKDPIHRFIEITDADKGQHEQARLLYVACTRARRSLHLMGHVATDGSGEDLRPPVRSSLLGMLWPAVESVYADAMDAAGTPPGVADEEAWLEPVLRRFAAPWQAPGIASLPGEIAESDTGVPTTEVEFYWVGTGARIAGTLAHRWLQVLSEGRATLELERIESHRPITARWLREMGIGEALRDDITRRIEATLEGILGDERGRWLLYGDGAAELALTGVYDGQVESVILDRVRIDDDGQHWIVDYKTSSHEGGNLEGFLQAETDRYRPQLQKYASIYGAYAGTSARCALYFPLLQKFIEV